MIRPETAAAVRAIENTREIVLSRRGAEHITSKGGIDLVTEADIACEDAIRAELLNAFPEYPVIGEERGGLPREGSPYWLVDPICGTRTFASNIPLYCTNIALVENGEPTVAAVGMGSTGEIAYAELGRGATLRAGASEITIKVDDSNNLLWIDGRTEQAAGFIRHVLLSRRWYVMQFPSSLAYAHLACGRIAAAALFSWKSSPDPYGSVHSAAGCLLAREAGAIVTDLHGASWTLSTRSILIAATTELHRTLSQFLQDEI
jgi:myo-inositol-1(or 4)-monophosphatase